MALINQRSGPGVIRILGSSVQCGHLVAKPLWPSSSNNHNLNENVCSQTGSLFADPIWTHAIYCQPAGFSSVRALYVREWTCPQQAKRSPNSAKCNLSNMSGLRERTRPAFILVIGDCSSPAESLAAPTHSTCHMLIFLSVQQGSGRRTDHRGYHPPTRRKLMVTLREPELKILSVFNGFPNEKKKKKKKCRMKSIWVLKKSEVRLFTPNYWWINMSRNEFVYCSFVLLCSV